MPSKVASKPTVPTMLPPWEPTSVLSAEQHFLWEVPSTEDDFGVESDSDDDLAFGGNDYFDSRNSSGF